MPVKDIYGKEVSEQNHMILAHNPLSHLIKNMSDREIMEAKGLGKKQSIINPEFHHMFGPKVKLDTKFKDFKHMPNQKRHKIVSLIKSTIRIAGYVLIPYSIPLSVSVLVLSEVVGIIEELV
jgi:hypothetical protein